LVRERKPYLLLESLSTELEKSRWPHERDLIRGGKAADTMSGGGGDLFSMGGERKKGTFGTTRKKEMSIPSSLSAGREGFPIVGKAVIQSVFGLRGKEKKMRSGIMGGGIRETARVS